MSVDKLECLENWFKNIGSCLVAYSGGVDSVFLASVACRELGEKSLAVIADSPSLSRRELNEAVAIAKAHGIPLKVVRSREFDKPEYLANPLNRCYFCKKELFLELVPLARELGLAAVVYGENASDIGDFRPGAQAAVEMSVRAPLKELGITKAEIRAFSSRLGLPTAEKAQMACLSSRIPYGEAVTPEKMRMIEEAENALRDMGFFEVRVRHHELKLGHLARIELGRDDMAKIFVNGVQAGIAEALKKAGYAHVTLDLLGYRRGSMNEGLVAAKA